MIKTWKRTPRVYSKESRDYQLLSILFDLGFNSSKTPIDTMLNLYTTNIDYRFLDLACRTIGFNYNGTYTDQELADVLESFKYLTMNKGRKEAIIMAINLLLNSQNIKSEYYIQWESTGSKIEKSFNLMLPPETKNVKLLDEIFEYILPFGWVYTITYGSVSSSSTWDYLIPTHNIRSKKISDSETDISNYLDSSGNMKDLSNIGQVPVNTANQFTSPVVNFDTVISHPDQIKKTN